MKDPVDIRTPLAVIRSWERSDAPSITKYANNPKIAANVRDSFPSPFSLEDAERYIEMATGESPLLLLAIEIDGEPCGSIWITPLTEEYRKTAEIGYWLAEPFWGRGIMTEVMKAIVPVIFERLDIVRLQAGVYEGNLSSMRVLEKAGFERESVHKKAVFKGGVMMDEVYFVFFSE
jgi:[ribosomal protein S5]-alanine N-acetyltransferase